MVVRGLLTLLIPLITVIGSKQISLFVEVIFIAIEFRDEERFQQLLGTESVDGVAMVCLARTKHG